jgi:hypothetical protein
MQSKGRTALRAAGVTLAAAIGAAVVAVGTATAASPALTVQAAPGTITVGQPALAIATLTNGSIALTGVTIKFTFPLGVAVTAPGCSPESGVTSSVTCGVGKLAANAAVTKFVKFVAPNVSSLQVGGTATWSPHSTASATSNVARVFPADDPSHTGTCTTGHGSLDAELSGQGTEVPTVPSPDPSLHLPCTPVSVGVDPRPETSHFGTDIASVELPRLLQPATVQLTFRAGELPGTHSNPNSLREIPNLANLDPSTFIVVPLCSGGTIPSGFDACILGVAPDSLDGGVITLLVQGSGFDPSFVG